MTDYRINVIVDPAGANRGVQQVERNLNRARGAALGLGNAIKSALAVAGLGFGIQQVIQLADAYTEMRNAVRLAVGATGDLEGTMDRLFNISNATLAPVDAMTALFRRGAQSARELGASQEELFQFTEAVGQALSIQGTSATKAQGALLQLAQALGSGTVRAEEFNSINEGANRILQAVADGMDGMGGSVSRLRNEVLEGRISSQEFFDALLSQAPQLAEEFATAMPTIGNSFTVLRNNMIRAFGEFNNATGASQGLARAILWLGQHADVLINVAEALAYALGVKFAVQAIQAAVRGLATLGVAIAKNPLGALATAITYAGAALIAFSDELPLTAGSSASAFDFIAVAFGDLAGLIGDGVQWFIGLFGDFENALGDFDFLKFVRKIGEGVGAVIGFFVGMYRAVVRIFEDFPRIVGDLMIQGLNAALRAGTSFVNGIIDALNKIPGVAIDTLEAPAFVNPFQGAAAEIGALLETEIQNGISRGGAIVDSIADRAAQRAETARRQAARESEQPTSPTAPTDDPDGARRGRDPLTFQRVLDMLAEEARLLQMTSREREIYTQLLNIEEDLRRDGVILNDAQRAQLETVLRQNQAYADQSALLEELQGPMEDLTVRQATLEALFARGAISARTFAQEMWNANVAAADLRIQMGDGTFMDAALTVFDRLTEKARNVTMALRDTFGDFFMSLQDGFADSVGRAIVYSEDLGAALQDVARSAIAELISGLVKLGIQWLMMQLLGETMRKTATAGLIAEGALVAAAWTPAATMVSLASFGANAGPAIAGMAATSAAASALAAIPGLKDGGMVNGPGSSRSDDALRWLSNGEFVMNAEATRRNRGLLEHLNDGGSLNAAALQESITNNFAPQLHFHANGNGDSGGGERNMDEMRRALMPELEKMFGAYVREQSRYRGQLRNPRGEIT